ncbi:MAG: hypothetical protein R2744_10710 [Bacteroidales bacterium]
MTLGLAFLAAAFLVRMFIIFHDCGHGSFFRSARANRVTGTILGILTFTPMTGGMLTMQFTTQRLV